MTRKLFIHILIIISSLVIYSSLVNAEIYKWTDVQGNIHFTDNKPDHVSVETLKLEINTYTSISYEDIGANNTSTGSETSSATTGSKNVSLYTTAWCGYCKKAKNYFRQNSIAYTEFDIEKDVAARKRYKKMGATGVPVIIVGNKRMNGFSVRGFERIYR